MNDQGNIQAVKDFFAENQWLYNEQEGCFESGLSLNSEVEGALLQVDANNGGIVTLCGLDFEIPEECFADLLELCNFVNMMLPTGALFLDMEERITVCRLGQYYGDGAAAAEDVGEQVTFCIDIIERLGNVINTLIEGGISPDEAAMQLLRPAEEE